jgi:GT2 family glycosyltransferase
VDEIAGDPLISILIVNYNTDHHLRACVESLAVHGAGRDYEVMVINNGRPLSRDDLDAGGLDLRVVNNRRNIGYAAALNQGIAMTQAPYVLCLNADTRVPDGSVEPLTEYLDGHREAGVVAPRLSYPDGSLQFSCRRAYTYGSLVGRRLPLGMLPMIEPSLRHHLMLDEDHGRVLRPDWVQGSCFMIPRRVLETVGGFDERFFLYFEDYEFCGRVLKHDLEVVYQPASEVTHYYARSSAKLSLFRKEVWHHAASALRYLRRSTLSAR